MTDDSVKPDSIKHPSQAPEGERIVVGRIVRAHGVIGEVLIDPTGEDPERFAPGTKLWVDPKTREQLTVKTRRGNATGYRVAFEGVPDRDAAEELKGVVLYQAPDALPPLPEGQYYHFQLVGLTVTRADGSRLGQILRVIEMPAGDIYQVQEESGEWLIPGRPEFIDWIDLAKQEVRLHDRDDLLEAVASPNTPREHKGRQKRRFRRKPGGRRLDQGDYSRGDSNSSSES